MANGDAGYDLDSVNILSEEYLRDLSRSAKKCIPTATDPVYDDQDINKYIATISSLIKTSSAINTLCINHQVAAWNALSTFIDQTTACHDARIRDVLWTAGVWQESFHVFLTHSPDARPKAAKQLLMSLVNALHKNQHNNASAGVVQRNADLLVDTILHDRSKWPVKSCLVFMCNILKKDILQLHDLDPVVGSEASSSCTEILIRGCIRWAATSECTFAAGQLLAVLLDKAEARQPLDGINDPPWVEPLQQCVSTHPEYIDAFRFFLMPALFRRDKQGFVKFVSRMGVDTHLRPAGVATTERSQNEMCTLLAALRVGNDCALVEITYDKILSASGCSVQLPLTTLSLLLRHADRAARIAGLSLLIDTHATSQPLLKAKLDVLRANLPHLHADTDLNFRGELFSLTQKLLDRLRTSTSHVAKQHQEEVSIKASYQAELDFLLWYQRFLLWELRPGASYQRHISSLRCLTLLMRSGIDESLPIDTRSKSLKTGGKWPFSMTVVHLEMEKALLHLMLNPFDDVRQTAASLLGIFVRSREDARPQHLALQKALQVAEGIMLASGRADQADAVAHMYTLLFLSAGNLTEGYDIFQDLIDQVELMLDTATHDLADAVARYPLHGLFISLRYLLEQPTLQSIVATEAFDRLARLLKRVWQVVKPILCDDAPEGFLPEALLGSATVSSKVVLSYCWRALKEASLLIDSILIALRTDDDEWSCNYKADLIELTFVQLAELRHRGAFSTVAQTWNRCCVIADAGIMPLAVLFERVLSLIQKATINTRRSAGMPSLMCGILVADSSGELFDQAFTRLVMISQQPVQEGLDDESCLPQGHAMNCLKDILKTPKLATQCKRYVPVTLQLAADSLPSKTWIIRNCGLMLFRAVIDRLVGTNESYEDDGAGRDLMDFRQRRPLLDQVLSLLPHAEHDVAPEGVFPALQLLQHCQLPVERQAETQQAIMMLLGNKSWLIRDKAARTLMSLLPLDTACIEVTKLLEENQSSILSHNMLHGTLLCLKHMIRAVQRQQPNSEPSDASPMVMNIAKLLDLAQQVTAKVSCPVIQEAVHDLVQSLNRHENAATYTAQDTTSSISVVQALRSFSSSTMSQDWLISRSIVLEAQAQEGLENEDKFLTDLEDWTACCEAATSGTSIFSSESVSKALSAFSNVLHILRQSDAGKQTLMRICLVTYDLLFDDDEDIRIAGASVVCRILAASKQDFLQGGLEPLIASQKLLAFMVVDGHADVTLAGQCLSRAFGTERIPLAVFDSVLDDLSLQDTTLFAEEKQNLYIDETMEAKSWTQAAKKLSPIAFQKAQIDYLAYWVAVGIDALVEKANGTRPGAFDWSTNEAAFSLGLRVIYAVELLLHLSDRGVRLPIRPSLLRESLLKLQTAAEKAELHSIWQAELGRVAKAAALFGFSAIQSLLNGVVGKLDSAATLQ